MPSAKDAARQIIEHLPGQATWDDIMYELYVKQKIEEGLADIEAGRTIPHEEVKAELLGSVGIYHLLFSRAAANMRSNAFIKLLHVL